MIDYITKEREKQRAIERWENEGGSARADFRHEAHEQERRDVRPSLEGISERAREIDA